MGEKLKVLMVGAAFAGDLHMEAYSRLNPDIVEVTGISNRDTARAEALAGRYGKKPKIYDDFNKAIKECDCDLVDVCVPNFLHYPVAMAALEMGRHVIVEKPLATTIEHGEEILALAEKKNKKVYYGENLHCSPVIRKALSIVESGKIGKLLYVRARECHSGSHSPYAQTIDYCGGGSMLHMGAHPAGFILALNEGSWTELVAMCSGGKEKNLRHKSLEGEDWGAAVIRFKDGFSALLEGNYITEGGMEDAISLYGTEGCLHIDLTFNSTLKAYSISGLD